MHHNDWYWWHTDPWRFLGVFQQLSTGNHPTSWWIIRLKSQQIIMRGASSSVTQRTYPTVANCRERDLWLMKYNVKESLYSAWPKIIPKRKIQNQCKQMKNPACIHTLKSPSDYSTLTPFHIHSNIHCNIHKPCRKLLKCEHAPTHARTHAQHTHTHTHRSQSTQSTGKSVWVKGSDRGEFLEPIWRMTQNQIDGGRWEDCSRGLVPAKRKCGDQ